MTTQLEPINGVMLLRQAVASADHTRDALAMVGDLDGLGQALVDVTNISRDLGILRKQIEADLVRLIPGKRHSVDGVGTFEVKASVSRKWDSTELLAEVLRHALDPDGNGEIPADPIDVLHAVHAAILAAVPITPSLGWRVTALRAAGIDPDEWAENTGKRLSIQVHGGES